MLEVLDSRQISEWMAYYAIEPFGQYPEYLRAGIIASTIANVNMGKKGRRLKPEDFIPTEPELEPKRQSMAEMKKVLQQIAKGAKKKPTKRKST